MLPQCRISRNSMVYESEFQMSHYAASRAGTKCVTSVNLVDTGKEGDFSRLRLRPYNGDVFCPRHAQNVAFTGAKKGSICCSEVLPTVVWLLQRTIDNIPA
jgi:hypothetical protein